MTKGGRSKKRQGSIATGASLSATNQFPEMQTLGRGLGSSFAMAVNKLIDGAQAVKGSLNPFLGVTSKTLDPVSYGNNTLAPKGFNARKKK
jgi:hypothetical protein